jgi:hypothetical protein
MTDRNKPGTGHIRTVIDRPPCRPVSFDVEKSPADVRWRSNIAAAIYMLPDRYEMHADFC